MFSNVYMITNFISGQLKEEAKVLLLIDRIISAWLARKPIDIQGIIKVFISLFEDNMREITCINKHCLSFNILWKTVLRMTEESDQRPKNLIYLCEVPSSRITTTVIFHVGFEKKCHF